MVTILSRRGKFRPYSAPFLNCANGRVEANF
jgi:hypothetical protein